MFFFLFLRKNIRTLGKSSTTSERDAFQTKIPHCPNRFQIYFGLMTNSCIISVLMSSCRKSRPAKATIACELYRMFDHFHWVGFYRNIAGEVLKIGPYQGSDGCLTIPYSKGVCGKCAREKTVQNVPDITQEADHIACSATSKNLSQISK